MPPEGREESSMSGDRYRVVQWATGNIGSHSLRAVIQHPDLDLVGLYVYSEDKGGATPGSSAAPRPPASGRRGTVDGDPGPATRLRPLHGGPGRRRRAVPALGAGRERRVDAQRVPQPGPARSRDPRNGSRRPARKGGASLHSTGSSPGFITEAMPLRPDLAAASPGPPPDRGVRRHVVAELAGDDLRSHGFRPRPRRASIRGGSRHTAVPRSPARWKSSPRRCRCRSTRWRQPARWRRPASDVDIAAGHVEAGTIAAQRMQVSGLRNGKPLLTFSANWYLSPDVEPAWDLRETGWHLLVEGDTPLDIDVRFPVPPDEWAATSPGLTAHRPVNAIPYVCRAEPGIRTIVDLPQIIASFA